MNQETNSANKWQNVTGNGLVTIPGRWELIAIVVNSKGASSNVAKIYDDIEGEETPARLIATLDTTDRPDRFDYGLPMFRGINVRLQTGTAANLTIIYKEMI